MERKPFIWSELFDGNWELFQNALQNPETFFVYDIDGILANTYKIVTQSFTEKTGIRTNPAEIREWDYLTRLAKEAGLDDDLVRNAENDWYDPKVLVNAQKYLYITPVVEKTLRYYGPSRNFALTSRLPSLEQTTRDWFFWKIPKFDKENILIRDDPEADPGIFKVENLAYLAKHAPWIVYIDDSTGFCKAALDAKIDNCLVVNIPVGNIMPKFRHERLFVIKRFPDELQAMYPFMYAIYKALR